MTRTLAVLALLLGLLAMHGLASTQHTAAAATTTAHGAAQHQPATTVVEHHQHEAVPPVVQDPAALAAPIGPTCGDDCPDLAVLCVAVLTGAALLALLLAHRRTALALPARDSHDVAPRAPPVRYTRGPDPVETLCVSRT